MKINHRKSKNKDQTSKLWWNKSDFATDFAYASTCSFLWKLLQMPGANNNSVAETAFQLYRIQCIKSAKISLKWTVSHLYCQLAFQPFKCSECITMEKITEAWAAMWAFKVLFITSQFWLLFFLSERQSIFSIIVL